MLLTAPIICASPLLVKPLQLDASSPGNFGPEAIQAKLFKTSQNEINILIAMSIGIFMGG
jgi:hypothetical protein